jgi:hypothetical protein
MNKFRLLCAAAAIVAPSAAYAQETTATIRGTVTANGAAVRNAEVRVEHLPTGQSTNATTNEEGAFVFTGLNLGGPIRVTVTAPGFQSAVVEDIFASAGEALRLPIELAAEGQAEADIVVTGELNRGGQTLSPTTTLRRDDIEGVATVNRDVRDLIRRSPFAQLDPTNVRATSIAGQNPRFNRFSVNGVQFNDTFGLNNGGLPTSRGPVPLDAICQFSVEVAPVDIREGDFQGGAINTQLCQGTNRPTGGAFYTYSDDSLSGDSVDGIAIDPEFTSKAYGAFLRGPIIPNTLFFAVAWERTRDTEPTSFGPVGSNFANITPGIDTAEVALIQDIARNQYGFDAGGVPISAPENDDRVTARVDWNVNDDHDLSLTYIYNEGTQFVDGSSSTSTTQSRLALFSNSYTLSEIVHSGVAQINSRWSDMFSTEARISYRDYQRGQTPPNGREFGEFNVCLAPTGQITGGDATRCENGAGTIRFGPDISRQANDLNTENMDAQVVANLLVGSHSIRFLAQYTDVDVYNLFLQRASGAFYFDSIADFRAGRANQLALAQSTTGDINGAAAIFDYQNIVFGVQDTWDITDAVTLIAGLRYEWYDMGTPPALNQFFTNRYGFSNQETLNGRDILLPRIGLSWRVTDRLQARGSFGRFSGGSPAVYISNSYSNTGVTQNSVTFNRTGNPTATNPGCSGFTGAGNVAQQTALCNAALNGVFRGGAGVPNSVTGFIQNSTAALALAGVNAIDPDLELASQWRAAGTVSYNADLGPLGDNWFFAVDALYSWVDKAIDYTDLRSVRIGTAPDGRPRYGPFPGTSGNNSDLLLTNSDEGHSLFLVGRVNKEWESGFSFGFSYTYADVEERSPLTSSVAFSNYQNQATADPNFSTLGTSNEQITHSAKLNLGFRREFFEGAETRIQLFGEWRNGRPFSYTFDSQQSSGRDPLFGVFGSDTRHLLYVPTGLNDPLVTGDAATLQALDAFISSSVLQDYRGRIADKNIGRSDDVFRLDLHVSQDIPLPAQLGRVRLFADMENVLNFINDEWGVIRQVGFPYAASIVDVTCAQTSGNNCTQYRYANFREPNVNLNTSPGVSTWQLRIGARYTF